MEYILLLFGGLLAGTIGSLVGLGGGIVIVPLLLGLGAVSILPMSPQIAVGTSMITVVFTGLASTLAYMKLKRVDYKSSLYLFVGSGPGGIAGSWVNRYLNDDSFSLYFGIFIILVAILLTLKHKQKRVEKPKKTGIQRQFTTTEGDIYTYGFHLTVAIPIAFLIGFISGLFGIGGGSLLVPALILLFSFPPHIAIPTSMLIVFLSAIVSAITHITLGNVNWLFALLLIPGAWFGGKLGAYINSKLSSNTIVTILRIVLVIVGIRMIV
ncbi:sulfite exporter TauE/SafE family protein [Lederbergia sp. NSJ-179]|uniref:sulfite exporter TauE/SafE family protein n=1 Tax=Lederbergia sp. NSJ-179 TaxID=2931402 RepID=UPI001FD0F4B7|nr:sulfite exporter TauE/SafE family protein [Lederbergia sp. NSJ-179]MCJ7840475.1 sulfite exporter TauE/SafE family protein [Lederbergia sp. NSJ-179]